MEVKEFFVVYDCVVLDVYYGAREPIAVCDKEEVAIDIVNRLQEKKHHYGYKKVTINKEFNIWD